MSLQNNALTTLATVKKHISDGVDDILEAFINTASDQIESYCNRKFGLADYAEKYDGNYSKYININNYPIHSVELIKVDDQEIVSTDYELISERGQIYYEDYFQAGTRNIEITYNAGYVLPKDATEESSRTLPSSLETACIVFVKILNSECGLGTLQSERMGDYSVSYVVNDKVNKNMPDAVKNLISPYRRRVL